MTKTQIMVVEDEGIVALSLKRKLIRLGYEVMAVVSSGEEALEEIAHSPPDLILMDIILAGQLDGVETAGQIQANFNIPLIYLTAHSDNHTLQRVKETQPDGYLIKPFEENELQLAIETALAEIKQKS